jgi:integrase
MAYAGLRTDEVLKLQVKDINLDQDIINTVDIKSATNQAKTDWVPIDEILRPILEESVNGAAGKKLFPKTFNYTAWHKACDRLGLNEGVDPKDRVNRLTPYSLRLCQQPVE